MPRLVALLPLVLAAAPASALAGTGTGPAIVFEGRCYSKGVTVRAVGTGLTPLTDYSVALGSAPLGTGTTDDTGRTAIISFPAQLSNPGEAKQDVTIADGAGLTATGFYTSTILSASATGSSGNPSRVRPKFSFYGFGAGRTIWMHYIDPRGRHVKARRMGRAGGLCGRLQTGRRKLFVVTPRPGAWRFQFDTRQRYSPTAKPRVVRDYFIRLG